MRFGLGRTLAILVLLLCYTRPEVQLHQQGQGHDLAENPALVNICFTLTNPLRTPREKAMP